MEECTPESLSFGALQSLSESEPSIRKWAKTLATHSVIEREYDIDVGDGPSQPGSTLRAGMIRITHLNAGEDVNICVGDVVEVRGLQKFDHRKGVVARIDGSVINVDLLPHTQSTNDSDTGESNFPPAPNL